MTTGADDRRWLAAAAHLAARGQPASRPNPAVGALLLNNGVVVGRGWTQPGGRPHAEAMALAEAGAAARGATLYATLEPCAHDHGRGPACAASLTDAGIARAVIGVTDPDPRTAGKGIARLRDAGVAVDLVNDDASRASLAGYLTRTALGRPHVTLKLALSLDGAIATGAGESRWITGAEARAQVHALRARCDAILVGGGTLRTDAPALDVRLPGLEERAPERWVLTRGAAPAGWRALHSPADLAALLPHQSLLVEGGAEAAAAFLAADTVDRLVIHRAPIVIGGGKPAIGDIGLGSLAQAHGRWQLADRRTLGSDTCEVYERSRCLPG